MEPQMDVSVTVLYLAIPKTSTKLTTGYTGEDFSPLGNCRNVNK